MTLDLPASNASQPPSASTPRLGAPPSDSTSVASASPRGQLHTQPAPADDSSVSRLPTAPLPPLVMPPQDPPAPESSTSTSHPPTEIAVSQLSPSTLPPLGPSPYNPYNPQPVPDVRLPTSPPAFPLPPSLGVPPQQVPHSLAQIDAHCTQWLQTIQDRTQELNARERLCADARERRFDAWMVTQDARLREWQTQLEGKTTSLGTMTHQLITDTEARLTEQAATLRLLTDGLIADTTAALHTQVLHAHQNVTAWLEVTKAQTFSLYRQELASLQTLRADITQISKPTSAPMSHKFMTTRSLSWNRNWNVFVHMPGPSYGRGGTTTHLFPRSQLVTFRRSPSLP